MSEFLTKAQEQFIIIQLFWSKCLMTVGITFCLAWQTAMAQNKWSKLDHDEQFYTACCIGGLVLDKLIAFIDKMAATIQKGKLPIGEDNTTTFQKVAPLVLFWVTFGQMCSI